MEFMGFPNDEDKYISQNLIMRTRYMTYKKNIP